MAKAQRKAQAKLNSRIADWERTKTRVKDPSAYTKSGSNKK